VSGRIDWFLPAIPSGNSDRCVCTNCRMIIDRGRDTMYVDVRKIENNSDATVRRRVFNYNWKNYNYSSN
jgi:hypothetical protein